LSAEESLLDEVIKTCSVFAQFMVLQSSYLSRHTREAFFPKLFTLPSVLEEGANERAGERREKALEEAVCRNCNIFSAFVLSAGCESEN
jgi:hypothetical protein